MEKISYSVLPSIEGQECLVITKFFQLFPKVTHHCQYYFIIVNLRSQNPLLLTNEVMQDFNSCNFNLLLMNLLMVLQYDTVTKFQNFVTIGNQPFFPFQNKKKTRKRVKQHVLICMKQKQSCSLLAPPKHFSQNDEYSFPHLLLKFVVYILFSFSTFVSGSCWGRMAGGESGRAFEYTPTWVVAVVCFVIVSISFIAERALHKLGRVLSLALPLPLCGLSVGL